MMTSNNVDGNNNNISSLSTASDIHCRICLDDDEEGSGLLQACLCKGTQGLVHEDCLKLWLLTSGLKKCELCKNDYKCIYRLKPIKEWRPFRTNGFSCPLIQFILVLFCIIAANYNLKSLLKYIRLNTIWGAKYNSIETALEQQEHNYEVMYNLSKRVNYTLIHQEDDCQFHFCYWNHLPQSMEKWEWPLNQLHEFIGNYTELRLDAEFEELNNIINCLCHVELLYDCKLRYVRFLMKRKMKTMQYLKNIRQSVVTRSVVVSIVTAAIIVGCFHFAHAMISGWKQQNSRLVSILPHQIGCKESKMPDEMKIFNIEEHITD